MTSLYNINYLQHLCKKYGLTPSKKYGQNFLINEDPITKMLEAGEVKKDDVVVEVGPGFGVLTLALAEKAKKVTAFEIEKKLMSYWEEQLWKNKNIEIVWGNVLKQDINLEKYKVVANLPYQITSNVIRKFLEAENKPELMILMVQKEVAERICAKPGEMSVLSVSVQYYAKPEIVMQAPKSYFWPVPAVDSAVIKITPKKSTCHSDRASQRVEESLSLGVKGSLDRARDDSQCGDNEQFFKIVKAGFANRRKMLLKNLESVVGKQNKAKLKTVFNELGINEKVRAQELSIKQWQGLMRKIESMR